MSSGAVIFDTSFVYSAAQVVKNLGFSLVTDSDLADPSATDLVVALRSEPTLHHFDPEEVSYWGVDGTRGRQRTLDRDSPMPLDAPFLWGRISIVDRLGMSNQWLSFGGSLHAEDLDPDTTIVVFASTAPIQRWSGHSQGLDLITAAMGAFFARLMIPIDFEAGAEARIVQTDPRALYCAFLADHETRVEGHAQFSEADRPLGAYVEREARRLRTADPRAWETGVQLLGDLGLAG